MKFLHVLHSGEQTEQILVILFIYWLPEHDATRLSAPHVVPSKTNPLAQA